MQRRNKKSGRKLDVLEMLRKEYALSTFDVAKKLGVHVTNARRYLRELLAEGKIYKRYRLPDSSGKQLIFYYSLRRNNEQHN